MSDEKVVVSCPHCSSSMKAPVRSVGRRVACPRCGKEFRIELAISEQPEIEPLTAPPLIQTGHRPTSKSAGIAGKSFAHFKSANPTRNMMAVYVISGIAAALLLLMLLTFVARLGEDSFIESVKQLFQGVLAIPLLIGMAAFYVLPSIIAFFRGHENFVPILIVNLFAGWTMLGWVASLAWSFSSSVKESRQYVRQVVVHESPDDRWKEKDG